MSQADRAKAKSAAAVAAHFASLPPVVIPPVVVPLVTINYTGVYFIDPTKVAKHDSYYNAIEQKIPNPTMRTALIGE
jgi:hypothetical protein